LGWDRNFRVGFSFWGLMRMREPRIRTGWRVKGVGLRVWRLGVVVGALLLAGWAAAVAVADHDCLSRSSCWLPWSPTWHWDGRAWSRHPVPASKGASEPPGVADVSCDAKSDCWAVGGEYVGPPTGTKALTWHWNGARWSHFWVAKPPNATSVALDYVSCPSASGCWALGSFVQDGTRLRMVLRWNHRRWQRVRTFDSAKTAAWFLSCRTDSDCWIGGLLWDGRHWSEVPFPEPPSPVDGAACMSASDCWVVGTFERAYDYYPPPPVVRSWAMHWDGNKWATARIPHPDGTGSGSYNQLTDVTCTAGLCWAVGASGGSTAPGGDDPPHGVMLKWDGTRWTRVRIPHPAGGAVSLVWVACASSTDCWAAGRAQSGTNSRLWLDKLHWNGTTWTRYRANQN
jgi:hypothetical protein